ncbi:hypothetical protein Tco_1322164 [Tanacetum coccineum]
MAPPLTLLESPPTSLMAPPGFSPTLLLTTPKTTLPPLTSPPPAPSEPSKQTSPLAINLEPVELIFSTSPHPFFDSLEDLPPRTTNPPPPQPSFNSIKRSATQPPSFPRMHVTVNDLRDEMRFILDHILERLTILTHQNFP